MGYELSTIHSTPRPRRLGVSVLFGVLAAGLVGGASLPAGAETLSICYEDWPPYSTPTSSGHEGIQITLTTRALASMGHDVVFVDLPYKRCVFEVAQGSMDAMLLTDSEPELFPSRVATAWWLMGVFVHQDSPLQTYESLDTFAGLRFGTVDGYDYPPPVEAYEGWTRDSVTDAETNLRKLGAGRVDVVIDDAIWVESVIRAEGLAARRLKPLFSAVPQYTYFSPARRDLIPAYDAALTALLNDGTVDAVYQGGMGTSFHDLTSDLTVFFEQR